MDHPNRMHRFHVETIIIVLYLHSDGFLDWGGGGGGMTGLRYEPGLSPLSLVLERDQSEVEPCDLL